MTQEQFDAHASIKRLASWERVRKSLPDFVGDPTGSIGTQSMEVPFAALRVGCPCLAAPPGENYMAYEEHPVACKSCWVRNKHSIKDCDCGGRDWVPEPNVEKADFRCLLVLARKDLARAQGVLADMAATGAKGLAIRAAEVWMEKVPG